MEKITKIYLMTNEKGLKYVGKTTCKYLSERFAVHKSQAKTKRNINKCTSHLLFDCEVKIELLEETTGDDETIKLLEGKYIQEIDCVNKCVAGRTFKETKQNWVKNNPDYFKEYQRKNHSTTSGKKYYCECCEIEMLNTSKYRHFKTDAHKLKTK